MPELPEVETVCRGIAPHVVGRTIAGILTRIAGLRQPFAADLHRLLSGQTIVKVSRRAKYLLIYTDYGAVIIHLGMTGVLRVIPQGMPPGRHDHLDLILSGGDCLRLTDPRRFGLFLYCPSDPLEHPLLRDIGPEPLTDAFGGELMYEQSQGRSQAVKAMLMDQKLVAGVGNIYASEALFRAGINPVRRAGLISLDRYRRLATEVKSVLSDAIVAGGTTISDFRDSTGRPGYFARQLQVYGRAGLPCTHCGRTIQSRRVGQRSTFYCSNCQR